MPPKKKTKLTPQKGDGKFDYDSLNNEGDSLVGDVFLLEAEPSKEFSGSTQNISPFKRSASASPGGRKKSFKKLSVGTSGYIPLNDDCDELTTEDVEEVIDKAEPKISTRPEQDEQETSIVNTMTIEQMQEHVSQCLQLNTENKINTKNAFALKLIDCMAIIQRSTNENNFAAMACQLDAGAKIYSHRVDALHQQTLKLVESCMFTDKKFKNKGGGELDAAEDGNNDDSITDKALGKRKKSKKKVLAANPEQISRKLKENDPREKYVRCEALPGGIFEKVNRDPMDLSLTLDKDTPFWQNWQNYKPTKALGQCEINIKGKSYKNDTLGPVLEIHSNLDFSHIPKLENLDHDNDDDYEEPMVDFDDNVENDNENDVIGEVKCEKKPEVEMIARAMSRMTEDGRNNVTRLDVMKAVFHKPDESDYHYLKMDNSFYWAGPDYWKRPNALNAAANKKKVLRKKKLPSVVEYTDEASKRKSFNPKKSMSGISSKRSTILSVRTVNKWTKKKVTNPVSIHFQPQSLFMLFHVEVVLDKFLDSKRDLPPDSQDDDISFIENNAVIEGLVGVIEPPNDSDENGANDGHDSDDHEENNFDAVAEPPSDDEIPNGDQGAVAGSSAAPESAPDPIEVAGPSGSGSCDVYEGANLVPMVKTVKVEPIQYTAKPNRVDMRHLKEVMLTIILRAIEDRENVLQSEGVVNPRGTVMFRNVLVELFNTDELHPRTRADLSTSMAFLALLSLANENNFAMDNDETGDVIIGLTSSDAVAGGSLKEIIDHPMEEDDSDD